MQGLTGEQFPEVIDPKLPVERKRAVANTIPTVFQAKPVKEPAASGAPGGAAALTSPRPNVAKPVLASIQQLRDALEHGMPHTHIYNLRKVLPQLAQRIVTTCCSHNVHHSKPGQTPARKAAEPLYRDAAAAGKQYTVHALCEGSIWKAHYTAAQINIATGADPPVYVWINFNVRCFEAGNAGRHRWTSGIAWWCTTYVDETHFRGPGESAPRSTRENDCGCIALGYSGHVGCRG